MENINNSQKIIGAIIHFALDESELTDRELQASIAKRKINICSTLPSAMQRIKKALDNSTADNWQKLALQNRENFKLISQKVSNFTQKTREELLTIVEGMIDSGEIQVQHRDFNNLSDADLLSLLDDYEKLKVLNEPKNEGQ